MTRLGFDFADIKVGGQYHDDFLNLFLRDLFIPEGDRRRALDKKEIVQGKYVITIDEEDLPGYNWFASNHSNIFWDGLEIYIEAPYADRTLKVPAWFPEDRFEVDENGEPTTTRKSIEDYGLISRVSTDQTKIILKITNRIIPNSSKFQNLVDTLTANAARPWTGYTIKQLRTILAPGGDYTPVE